MNWEKLRQNRGWHMRLVPPVIHLDADGDPLPEREEDWIIMSSAEDYLEIQSAMGFSFKLGKDHIKNFTSDPERSIGPTKYGLLTLLVQLKTQGMRMWHVTTPMPGVAAPHTSDRAVRAREHFAPELAQVMHSLVYTLDRANASFGETSMGRRSCPGDTWRGLMPDTPSLFPSSPAFSELSSRDSRLLSEFYTAVNTVVFVLKSYEGQDCLQDMNAWNGLVQRTEHALELGLAAAELFCPDRQFDPIVPVAGSLVNRVNRSLAISQRTRAAHIQRFTRRI